MKKRDSRDRLREIAAAYDRTVTEYAHNIDPLSSVPVKFRQSEAFKRFMKECPPRRTTMFLRRYLRPKNGMKFLDVGCSANLYNYDHGRWPSQYFGIDISKALINAMQGVAKNHRYAIGSLKTADMAAMPFDDDFFDIAAVIGVLEYWNLPYIKRAMRELFRVLGPDARVVMDFPNPDHPDTPTMRKLEAYLGRPHATVARIAFERVLNSLFIIDRIDDEGAMMTYYVRRKR
jgi:ubiquinone/menaquinone biosynthesis C-methylase UbiE